MKTFLGFTNGLLLGCIGGAMAIVYMGFSNKYVREYFEKNRID